MFQILETAERLYDPLNNLSKMWIIDKEKCYSHEKDLLSCLKEREIMRMKEKEQKIIFFMGLPSIP